MDEFSEVSITLGLPGSALGPLLKRFAGSVHIEDSRGHRDYDKWR
ncbi:1560_t:CDS:2 [Acaulospora colombiana]|uniref:1560_t:CDS:1 n=1 Tax=Acaulospora colombiana TaxID=27376 RepID=A0ACA9NF25_9GLOM|nr:1560_t:CDS:2 [Acaulospora colombiana]